MKVGADGSGVLLKLIPCWKAPPRLTSPPSLCSGWEGAGCWGIVWVWRSMEVYLCSKDNGTLLWDSTPPGVQGGPVPHTPPPVLVWRDPYHAEAASKPMSAPSNHDVPAVLDLWAMSPSTFAATSDCWLTQAGSDLHSLLSMLGEEEKGWKHASTKHRKGCFSFIVEISKIRET